MTLIGLVLRVLLLFMGLLFFASVMAAALLLLVLWLARAAWCKLTGQPVAPWTFHVRSRSRWQSFYRSAGQWPRPGAAAGRAAGNAGDVIDVEVKEPGSQPPAPPALR